jgi:Osmosensitive K+ channel His kinase sensor domain
LPLAHDHFGFWVAQITGVLVRETVPDRVIEQADEVELIDLTPDDLLQRLREGKDYVVLGRARHAQLLPQTQPDRPARAGAAPHGRPGGCADAWVYARACHPPS